MASESQKYAEAMYDRLVDALPVFWDFETKELIGQAFLSGLATYPDLLQKLKSSSLLESDYFEDQGEEPEERVIEGNRYRIRIKTSSRK